MGGKRFLVSSSRAQPRDLFRLPFAVFLRKSICMKHRDPQSHEAYGVSRSPLPSQLLPDRERKRFLASARNDDAGKAAFSLLPLEGGGAQRRRLASLSFAFGQPPALRASPFHGKGGNGFLPLLPPSSGRRWRVAPEVGFALFRLRPTPCPSGIPLPWEGGRWVTHPVSPSFLWKEVARSAGGWLHSLSSSANPLPFGQPPALRASPSTGRGIVSNDRHLHSQPLPIKKRTPVSESANPSSQHQLDGSIVPILAKRRKVNHSRFRIATQKPLPLGKRPPAGRGMGRRLNKQPIRSYG